MGESGQDQGAGQFPPVDYLDGGDFYQLKAIPPDPDDDNYEAEWARGFRDRVDKLSGRLKSKHARAILVTASQLVLPASSSDIRDDYGSDEPRIHNIGGRLGLRDPRELQYLTLLIAKEMITDYKARRWIAKLESDSEKAASRVRQGLGLEDEDKGSYDTDEFVAHLSAKAASRVRQGLNNRAIDRAYEELSDTLNQSSKDSNQAVGVDRGGNIEAAFSSLVGASLKTGRAQDLALTSDLISFSKPRFTRGADFEASLIFWRAKLALTPAKPESPIR